MRALRTGLRRWLPAALLAVSAGAAAAPQGWPARLLLQQQAVVAPGPADGPGVRELSALAWDATAGELLALGDRGVLVRLGLGPAGGPLAPVPRSALRISHGRDGEALHARPGAAGAPPQWWMLAETVGHLVRLGPQGEALETRAWPLPGSGKRARAEALAWTPDAGFLVAPQRAQPLALAQGTRSLHAVHADGGRWWAFEPAAAGSHVKAIEALAGGALLVLERVPLPPAADGGRSFRTLLRLLRLPGCGPAQVCPADVLPVQPPIADGPDNFEGLACADDGRCWIVSDSGPDRATPTRLLQLKMQAP